MFYRLRQAAKGIAHCKGLFYRYNRYHYLSSVGDLKVEYRFRILKRRSCEGCSKCQVTKDEVAEFVAGRGVLYCDPADNQSIIVRPEYVVQGGIPHLTMVRVPD